MWCLQLWYVGYGDGREGRTLTLTTEKVDQANSTISVDIWAGREGWVWKSKKRKHDKGRPRHSKTFTWTVVHPVHYISPSSSWKHSSRCRGMKRRRWHYNSPISISCWHAYAALCLWQIFFNLCFGGSNDKSSRHSNCQNLQLRQYSKYYVELRSTCETPANETVENHDAIAKSPYNRGALFSATRSAL